MLAKYGVDLGDVFVQLNCKLLGRRIYLLDQYCMIQNIGGRGKYLLCESHYIAVSSGSRLSTIDYNRLFLVRVGVFVKFRVGFADL